MDDWTINTMKLILQIVVGVFVAEWLFLLAQTWYLRALIFPSR